MKTYTREEFDKICLKNAQEETDNQGQIIFYTGFFLWNDGTIRDTAEEVEDEDTTYMVK